TDLRDGRRAVDLVVLRRDRLAPDLEVTEHVAELVVHRPVAGPRRPDLVHEVVDRDLVAVDPRRHPRLLPDERARRGILRRDALSPAGSRWIRRSTQSAGMGGRSSGAWVMLQYSSYFWTHCCDGHCGCGRGRRPLTREHPVPRDHD